MPCPGGCIQTPVGDFKENHIYFLPNGNLHVPSPRAIEGYRQISPQEMEPIWPPCQKRFQSPMQRRDGSPGMYIMCNSSVAIKSGQPVTVKDCTSCEDRVA
jgi:hypothetical protein